MIADSPTHDPRPQCNEAHQADVLRFWEALPRDPVAARHGVRAAGAQLPSPVLGHQHVPARAGLHDGVNPVQVARWLGHNVSMTYSTYAHVIDDLDPDDRRPAADMIRDARGERDKSDATRPRRGRTGRP